MNLDFLWGIVAALLGGYVFVFWFLKRVNEWYYVGTMRKTTCRLPPGDMGCTFLGNMLPLFKTRQSGDSNSFIHNLVTRYGKTGIYKTHMFGSPSIIVCTPKLCRRILTNDENFVKSTYLLTGRRSLHRISNLEHRRLRRLIASPINGHEVIDEMLRMANAFSLFREAKVDVNINGYIIPKGWKVLVWYGAVHMDPEIYENPQDFNPSRWNNLKAKAEAFIPFGAGSRFCPGSDLAKLIITIFIHHFILNYKLKRLNPDSPVTYIEAPMPTDKCLAQVIRIP
ncbi:beta-amyrin 11-oxidase-like [Fagus crenata]